MSKLVACILGSLFQSLGVTMVFYRQDKDLTKLDFLKFYLPAYFIILISAMFIPNQVRFIYCLLLFSLIIYYIIKFKNKKAIIYPLVIMIFTSITEIFTSLCMVIIGIDSSKIVNNNFYNLIANILIGTFTTIFISLPFVIKFLRKINNFFIKNNKMIYYLYAFIIMIYIIVSKNGLEFLLKSNLYLNILLFLGVSILILLILFNEIKQNQLKEINSQTLKHLEKYEKIITEQGKANHEFKNQLMVIKGYYEMNSPKLKEYLDEIVKQTSKSKSTYLISQLNKFPDGGIKGLLYYKFSEMEDYNIKYELHSEESVKSKFNKLNIDTISDITRVLGVLIDNAIEASKEAKEKLVSIDLTLDKSTIIFEICNTYKGKINKDKLGTGYTTKGKGRGYGLKLVNDIIKLNYSYDYDILIEENLYKVLFKIKTRKKKK